ncbi:type 1 fimbrial protein [Neisseriaceae bacterium TC5R-5]|nr:type 1 fimbrial protein [Neisseriaceae bacterium TC5R-5]
MRTIRHALGALAGLIALLSITQVQAEDLQINFQGRVVGSTMNINDDTLAMPRSSVTPTIKPLVTTVQTLSGQPSSNTCRVAAYDTNKNIILPTVSSSAFTPAYPIVGSVSFTITVAGCNSGLNSVAVRFKPSSNADPITGRLLNISTGTTAATNIQLQLMDSDGKLLAVGQTSHFFPLSGSGENRSATITYVAGYYATGIASPGNVLSNTPFELVFN